MCGLVSQYRKCVGVLANYRALLRQRVKRLGASTTATRALPSAIACSGSAVLLTSRSLPENPALIALSALAVSLLRTTSGYAAMESFSTCDPSAFSGSKPLETRNPVATDPGVCASRSTDLFIACISAALILPDKLSSTAPRLLKCSNAEVRTSGANSYTERTQDYPQAQ